MQSGPRGECMTTASKNSSLQAARELKNDEFYTQWADIEREINAQAISNFISQSPTGQAPDIIVSPHDNLGQLAANGVVAPVELGDRGEEFTKNARDAVVYNGVSYGVPYAVESVALVRNNALTTDDPATFDELRAEVETRVSLAADAALEKARATANEVVDTVEHKVNTLVDTATVKAHDFADAAEAKVHGFTRNAVGTAASKVGLTPQFFSSAQETLETVKSSNAVTIPPLMAAFAAGVALASRIQSMRHRDDDYDHDDRYDYDEDDDY